MEQWEVAVHESIRCTIADYNGATDRFRLGDLAGCFSPDGVLVVEGAEPFAGRQAIVDGLVAMLGPADSGRPPPSYVRHFVASTRFLRVTRESAAVSSYFAVLTDVGLDHWGRYADTFVPSRGRWLIAARRIVTEGFSEQSLLAPRRD